MIFFSLFFFFLSHEAEHLNSNGVLPESLEEEEEVKGGRWKAKADGDG